MRLIKMRGSEHETHPYRLAIESGGLKVSKLTPEEASKVGTTRRAAGRPAQP
jgi:hypothetical protein